jgi:hypothetical protein
MLEPYHITHTSTQLSAGLVEQFFVLFHRRSFF